ncbi:16S rRNA (guanine(527)-N(7))-methyltransferase RsmG [Mesoaciditoga lauensis]|uniref:16S rRNA (guanine(527)-N(7))-methyltransferase RsmG n=1 Tax=Mesoaciditoga lauensis TaxID=1495039 RepID=UPI00056537E2|nr:16S rRNA (guanine(527)-N(7))-methyltransferase RsmG [Mesoaciditoga lauensis]
MNTLITILDENDISLKKESIEKLQKYLSLLERWNKVHSLTSVHKRDIPYVFAVEPLLFAKEISEFADFKRCLDIGTGFGNPGMAMSLYFEDSNFFLVDSSVKKTALLRSALDMAEFDNVQVITARVEELPPHFNLSFDLVVSRGVGTIQKVTSYAMNFVKENGFVVILKARLDMEGMPKEIGALKLEGVKVLNVSYPLKKVRRYAVVYRKVKR